MSAFDRAFSRKAIETRAIPARAGQQPLSIEHSAERQLRLLLGLEADQLINELSIEHSAERQLRPAASRGVAAQTVAFDRAFSRKAIETSPRS